jgi:hypothetical protein
LKAAFVAIFQVVDSGRIICENDEIEANEKRGKETATTPETDR